MASGAWTISTVLSTIYLQSLATSLSIIRYNVPLFISSNLLLSLVSLSFPRSFPSRISNRSNVSSAALSLERLKCRTPYAATGNCVNGIRCAGRIAWKGLMGNRVPGLPRSRNGVWTAGIETRRGRIFKTMSRQLPECITRWNVLLVYDLISFPRDKVTSVVVKSWL